jgi:hypothetical protein
MLFLSVLANLSTNHAAKVAIWGLHAVGHIKKIVRFQNYSLIRRGASKVLGYVDGYSFFSLTRAALLVLKTATRSHAKPWDVK